MASRLDQDRSGALDAGELKRFALTDGGYKADEDNGLALLRDITRGIDHLSVAVPNQLLREIVQGFGFRVDWTRMYQRGHSRAQGMCRR